MRQGAQPPSPGPREALFPQGVPGSRFTPLRHSAASARGSGFRVGSGSTRIRHKGAPVPATEQSGGAGSGGRGGRQSPLRRQQAGHGEARGGTPGEGQAVSGTARDRSSPRSFPKLLRKICRGSQTRDRPSRAAAPPLPRAYRSLRCAPNRTAPNCLPILSAHPQRPAGTASPTRPFSVRKLFPRSRQRFLSRAVPRGDRASLCRQDPRHPTGNRSERRPGERSPQSRQR